MGIQEEDARGRALTALIDHARSVSLEREREVLAWQGLVTIKVDGSPRTLPAYAPYVGASYFDSGDPGARILILALSQNVSSGQPWVIDWLNDWLNGNGAKALDRQNIAFREISQIVMRPFDTGHLPILAAMVRHMAATGNRSSDYRIHASVSATNLSKWSFRSVDGRRTRDSSEALERCWEWITERELEILAPDFILCAGNDVFDVVSSGLQKRRRNAGQPRALKVAFPQQTVINTRYGGGPREGRLSADQMLQVLSQGDRTFRLFSGIDLEGALRKDAVYFAEMYESLRVQLLTVF